MNRASTAAPLRVSRRSGFTLIEILVVIVVIAILASLVAPNVLKNVDSAKEATAKSQIEMLGAALDAFRLDTGRYPTTEEGLAALQAQPRSDRLTNWRGPYLRKTAVPLDPWRNPYAYVWPGKSNPTPGGYDLMSYGSDGQPGGQGTATDITSW